MQMLWFLSSVKYQVNTKSYYTNNIYNFIDMVYKRAEDNSQKIQENCNETNHHIYVSLYINE